MILLRGESRLFDLRKHRAELARNPALGHRVVLAGQIHADRITPKPRCGQRGSPGTAERVKDGGRNVSSDVIACGSPSYGARLCDWDPVGSVAPAIPVNRAMRARASVPTVGRLVRPARCHTLDHPRPRRTALATDATLGRPRTNAPRGQRLWHNREVRGSEGLTRDRQYVARVAAAGRRPFLVSAAPVI